MSIKSIARRTYNKIKDAIIRREHIESYALNQLDLKLLPYLNFKNGFFIEAGANDGINQSNTLLFEKKYGWKGLLIEPIPDLAKQCRINRPNCIVENVALVPFDYDKPTIEMSYSNLMSLVKGSMASEDDERAHVEKGCEIQNITTYKIEVDVGTLTSILVKHNIQKIDFLSLDVEGFELSVLKGIDFSKYRPKYILVEARFKDEIQNYLEDLYDVVAQIGYYDILFKAK